VAKQKVLVVGSTGKLGMLVAKQLKKEGKVDLRCSARTEEKIAALKKEYDDVVHLDLDDETTFKSALEGVTGLFIVTGYTVDMLVQVKTLVDAAINAKVSHIVHLGVFTPQRECTDAHFVWHQLLQTYIKSTPIPWTFLHPNFFMQNVLNPPLAVNGEINWFGGTSSYGWIALEDVAECTAKIFAEGPAVHGGKDYWFSTESLSMASAAKIIGEVVGTTIKVNDFSPQDLLAMLQKMGVTDAYMLKGVVGFFEQVIDGRLFYVGNEQDDCPAILGRKGLTFRQWADSHKEDLQALYRPLSRKV